MKIRKLLLLLILLTGLSCGIIGKNKFTAKPSKGNVNNSELKFDGLYIGEVENNSKKGLMIYSFYNNGIALEDYLSNENSFYEFGNKFDTSRLLDTIRHKANLYKEIKQAGGYRIVDNKIEVQIFEFVNYGMFEVCTYKGQVINDSTIFISSCNIKSKSNFCPDSFYLKYYKMLKPDSTNQLMKKSWYWEK